MKGPGEHALSIKAPGGELVTEPVRIAFVHEFPESPREWHMPQLIRGLQKHFPECEPRAIHGFLPELRHSGAHPLRLLNLAWVYLRTAWAILRERPPVVIVRTAPPGIQLWVALLRQLRPFVAVCWLLDYHPLIEAAILRRNRIGWLAGMLEAIDRNLARRFDLCVTLDESMARKWQQQTGSTVPTIVYPPWPREVESADSDRFGAETSAEVLALVYNGTLGKAHPVDELTRLLSAVTRQRPVALHYCGDEPLAERTLRMAAEQAGAAFVKHPRVAEYRKLGAFYRKNRIQIGIVLLDPDFAGMLTPSKSTGYLAFGLPVLYVGPPRALPDELIQRFGAGVSLSLGGGEAAFAEAVKRLTRMRPGDFDQGAQNAAAWLADRNADELATNLAGPLRNRIANAQSNRIVP